eukprot:2081604-Rhodomonas_salina.1
MAGRFVLHLVRNRHVVVSEGLEGDGVVLVVVADIQHRHPHCDGRRGPTDQPAQVLVGKKPSPENSHKCIAAADTASWYRGDHLSVDSKREGGISGRDPRDLVVERDFDGPDRSRRARACQHSHLSGNPASRQNRAARIQLIKNKSTHPTKTADTNREYGPGGSVVCCGVCRAPVDPDKQPAGAQSGTRALSAERHTSDGKSLPPVNRPVRREELCYDRQEAARRPAIPGVAYASARRARSKKT